MKHVLKNPCLILVSGPPGVGKSTLSRYLSSKIHCCYLDKDCIDEAFSPGDRGPHYTKEVEPKVLTSLLNLAEINLNSSSSALLDVPWTHILINTPTWREKISQLAKQTQSFLKIIECEIPEMDLKLRIQNRNLNRDQVKLTSQGWMEFKKNDCIGECNPMKHLPISTLNTPSENFKKILDYLEESN